VCTCPGATDNTEGNVAVAGTPVLHLSWVAALVMGLKLSL
jgi:hypothetical protein